MCCWSHLATLKARVLRSLQRILPAEFLMLVLHGHWMGKLLRDGLV